MSMLDLVCVGDGESVLVALLLLLGARGHRDLPDDLLLAGDLAGEVETLPGAEDGEGHLEVESVVHHVHVLLEPGQVLPPVVLETHEHKVGRQLAQTRDTAIMYYLYLNINVALRK